MAEIEKGDLLKIFTKEGEQKTYLVLNIYNGEVECRELTDGDNKLYIQIFKKATK
jgi:hypothetical protein